MKAELLMQRRAKFEREYMKKRENMRSERLMKKDR